MYQPSSVIVSTYTYVDVVNSVTHTTTKKITTTTTTKFTATRTTALSTTTTTTTTMTTTKPGGGFGPIRIRQEIGPDTTVVTPTDTPAYAATCYRVPRYVNNCLSLGATRSTTIITPAVDSETASSTIIYTASANASIYVNSTTTATTTTTLSSLHSTKTVSSTTTNVISTSTSTSFTKTSTTTTNAIKTTTLGTTTTTTTKSTASPTPYLVKVTAQTPGGSAPSEVGTYVDWLTVSYWPALASTFTYGDYALGFVNGAGSGDRFVVNTDGRLATIISSGSGNNRVNTQMYLTVVGGYVVPDSTPAADASFITCSIVTGGSTATLVSCNYQIYATSWNHGNGAINIVGATTSTSQGGQLTASLSVTSY